MLARIDEQAKKIEDIKDDEGKRETLEDLQVRQKWDIRIFEEREKLSSALCEQPVVLEQKFFALASILRHIWKKRKKFRKIISSPRCSAYTIKIDHRHVKGRCPYPCLMFIKPLVLNMIRCYLACFPGMAFIFHLRFINVVL